MFEAKKEGTCVLEVLSIFTFLVGSGRGREGDNGEAGGRGRGTDGSGLGSLMARVQQAWVGWCGEDLAFQTSECSSEIDDVDLRGLRIECCRCL